MKKKVAGVVYDTETAQRLCTYERTYDGQLISETSCRTPSNHYFLLQVIGDDKPAIIPMSPQNIADWSRPDATAPWKTRK